MSVLSLSNIPRATLVPSVNCWSQKKGQFEEMCHGVASRCGVRRVPAARLVTEMTARCVSQRGPRADSLRARSQTRTDTVPTPGISTSLLLFVSTPRRKQKHKKEKKTLRNTQLNHILMLGGNICTAAFGFKLRARKNKNDAISPPVMASVGYYFIRR